MTAKRPSRSRRTPRRDAPDSTPPLTDEAVVTILESRSLPADSMRIDSQLRRQLIEAEAYFIAERRGFAAGHELEDWVAAESAVDARLREMIAA